MKKTLTILMSTTIILGMASSALAGGEKKNPPRNSKEVEKFLKEAGGEHFPERMKISNKMSIDVEDTYFHVFSGSLKKGGYHIIIFNNVPEYLGYYASEYEPSDYEEGTVFLDSGDSDEDGNPTYYTVPIGEKGPADKIRIDGIPTKFVKAPGADEKKAVSGIGKVAEGGTAAMETAEEDAIQYRDWKITIQGKERTYNAIFVSVEKGKVSIKDSKRGKIATLPVSALSSEDVEYLKEITAKK